MSIVSRLQGLLDMELSTQLRFTFTLEENFTRPDDRGIRPGDRIRFSVRLCNHSSLPLRSVQGTICPTPVAWFRLTRFELAVLPPGDVRSVATIEARTLTEPTRGPILDQIGLAYVRATPDLSGIEFQEWGKPLVYARTGQRVPSRLVSRDPASTTGASRALPLSSIPALK